MAEPSPETAAVVLRLRAAGCVFAEEEADILLGAAATPAELTAMVDRRVAGLPLEQVVGYTDFCGVRIRLEPGVFVPRHRTELLVREAAALVRPGAVVVDLCCGSGAIGAALLSAHGPFELHASDVDPVAVRCARDNLEPLGATVHQGDLADALPQRLRGCVDVLVANVPYVPSGEIELLPREARLYEPRLALDGGADGLDVLRRVVALTPTWLVPGGHLLTETGEHQADAAVGAMRAGGLEARVTSLDDLDATVVIGRRPRS